MTSDKKAMTALIKKDQTDLIQWYLEHRRELPWRKNRNPYLIWISEVMLQQTTVTAVIPFYEKFVSRFPNLESLAQAKEHEVLESWAGLGYYSRARHLHRAALLLANTDFPETAAELLELPGFGPYTSRAVASLAFGEAVGVLDGNVIRILSRRYGLELNWWNSSEKNILQKLSDNLAQTSQNADVNQGMMELGATICTPRKPLCLMCPWKKRCVALKEDRIELLPKSKPRPDSEMWHWTLFPQIKKDQIYLTPLQKAPFLKNVYFPESEIKKIEKKPKTYHIKHSVTKYSLFITLKKTKNKNVTSGRWIPLRDIKKINPTSLMIKILKCVEKMA